MDPRDFALMPFGGAGGIYAGAVAEEIGMARVLVPPHAGVLSALGMLMTDVRHDVVQTRLLPISKAKTEDIAAIFDILVARADTEIARDRLPHDRIRQVFSCDLRYQGQAYEIGVPLPAEGRRPRFDAEALRAAFDAEHERLYGQCSPDEPVEMVNFRVGVIGEVERIDLPEAPVAKLAPRPRGHRRVWFSPRQGWIDCAVYSRRTLAPGASLDGPALIEDSGASITVLSGHRVEVGPNGTLTIDTGLCRAQGQPAESDARRQA
jgi:N-methylhydantoinase A